MEIKTTDSEDEDFTISWDGELLIISKSEGTDYSADGGYTFEDHTTTITFTKQRAERLVRTINELLANGGIE